MQRFFLLVLVIESLFIGSVLYGRPSTVFVYGPGGPYPAIREAASVYSKQHNVEIRVIKGPVSNWERSAARNADIIYSGSENMMIDFCRRFKLIKKDTVTPLYLRKSGLLVRPGNPKHIRSLKDLLKPGIKVLVVSGAGLIGVWEDMIGRTKDMNSLRKLRRNIVFFAPNSGVAKRRWIKDPAIDVWITWNIWQVANPNIAEFIPVKERYTIYRDCAIALTEHSEKNKEARGFFNFLKSKAARPIFRKWGWLAP